MEQYLLSLKEQDLKLLMSYMGFSANTSFDQVLATLAHHFKGTMLCDLEASDKNFITDIHGHLWQQNNLALAFIPPPYEDVIHVS